MKYRIVIPFSLLMVTALAMVAQSAELTKAATEGFNHYAKLTEQRFDEENRSGHLLWVDTLPEGERYAAYAKLRNGEILVKKQETKENGKEIDTPGAMIHDFVSVIFIPHINLQQVKVFFQDYNNMPKYYPPEVVRSRLLSRKGEHFKIYMRMYVKKVLTLVANANYDVRYKQLDAKRLVSTSYSTRIAEVENPDTPKEHELPVGKDRGLLWRSNSYWRAEEKDGGVYVQCEALTLTRDIPGGVKHLVEPFLDSMPKEFLENMMTNVRKGTEATAKAGRPKRSSG